MDWMYLIEASKDSIDNLATEFAFEDVNPEYAKGRLLEISANLEAVLDELRA